MIGQNTFYDSDVENFKESQTWRTGFKKMIEFESCCGCIVGSVQKANRGALKVRLLLLIRCLYFISGISLATLWHTAPFMLRALPCTQYDQGRAQCESNPCQNELSMKGFHRPLHFNYGILTSIINE